MKVSERIFKDMVNAVIEENLEYQEPERRVIEIRIHPNSFYELANEEDIMNGSLEMSIDGKKTFWGVPIIRDPKVDNWRVVI